MLSTDNTTQLITALAEKHITEAIVNAAKGKTVNKRTKKLSLSDEIKACFDVEQFLNNAAETIEKLILRKVEEAVSAASANLEKPKNKRAPKKSVVINSESDSSEITEAVPSDKEVKPKKKRVVKKVVTTEASVQATEDVLVTAEVVTTEQPVVLEVPTKVQEPKPKKKRANTNTLTDGVPVEAPKQKEKKARITKKDKQVEVSDSDASDSEKPKKKRIVKKVTTPILPIDPMLEVQEQPEYVVEAVQEQEDIADDSSVRTADFIRPLSISNELEEEDLSDIEEE